MFCSSDGETENQRHRQEQEQHTTESSSDDSTKNKILETALDFVHVHGWTTQSLAEAARAHGLPGIAHGMFPRGGGDLVHHFVRECNSQLAESLEVESREEEEEDGKRFVGKVILMTQILERPSIGQEHWNISDVSVLLANVIFLRFLESAKLYFALRMEHVTTYLNYAGLKCACCCSL